jgi:hypothetical protein
MNSGRPISRQLDFFQAVEDRSSSFQIAPLYVRPGPHAESIEQQQVDSRGIVQGRERGVDRCRFGVLIGIAAKASIASIVYLG